MTHLLVKKDFQLFYCIHVTAFLFTSAWPILGHFLSIFDGFFVKTTINRKFFAQNCDFFVILNISLPFWCKVLSGGGGGNFQFLANFGRFS